MIRLLTSSSRGRCRGKTGKNSRLPPSSSLQVSTRSSIPFRACEPNKQQNMGVFAESHAFPKRVGLHTGLLYHIGRNHHFFFSVGTPTQQVIPFFGEGYRHQVRRLVHNFKHPLENTTSLSEAVEFKNDLKFTAVPSSIKMVMGVPYQCF